MSYWAGESELSPELTLDDAFNEGNLEREAEAVHSDRLSEQESKSFKEAQHLLVNRDYVGCHALLVKLSHSRPDDLIVSIHIAILKHLIGQSDLEELTRRLTSMLHANTGGVEVGLLGDDGMPQLLLYNLALALYWLGRYEQAEAVLNKAKTSPEMVTSSSNSRSESLAIAWRKLRTAISLNSHCAEAALEQLNELDEHKRKRSNNNENLIRSPFETLCRGHALVVSKQFKVFKRDLRSNGLNEMQTVAFEFMRANLEFFRGNHRKAQKLLTLAAGGSSDDNSESPSQLDSLTQALMLNNLACISIMLKKPNYAVIQLQEALSKHEAETSGAIPLKLQRAQIVYNYGVALLHASRYDDALRCFSSLIDVMRTSPHPWLRMAECLIMSATDRQNDLETLQQPSNISKSQAKREGKSFNTVHLPGVHFKLVGRGMDRKLVLHDDERYRVKLDKLQIEQRLGRARVCLRNALTLINKHQKTSEAKSITRITSKLYLLKASVLSKLAYVSLSLNDPVLALRYSENCLSVENLPSGLANLARLYCGEALILLDRISEAIEYLDPKHVLDVSLDEPSESDGDLASLSNKRASGDKVSMNSELGATKAIFSINLAIAFLLRGELDKAWELLEQLWNSRNTHCVGAAVLKAKLYVMLRRDQVSSARELIQQNCALSILN